jgi:hypothetical protein
MAKTQKDKGARGEIMFRDFCREHGFSQVQRGGQLPFQKGDKLADVIGLAGVHLEIKNVEKLNVREAEEQAEADCQKSGRLPILAHKKNRKPWLITMRADDWILMYKAWLKQQPAEAIQDSLISDYLQLFAKNVFCWRKAGYP